MTQLCSLLWQSSVPLWMGTTTSLSSHLFMDIVRCFHVLATVNCVSMDKIGSFVLMDPESVTQSEVSQKEKNKYRILTHMYGIQENGRDRPIFRAGVERGHVDTVGEGEGGMS